MPEDYRRTYLILSFLKAFQIVRKHEGQNQDQLLSALNILDTGIVIGTGLDECSLLTDFAQVLHEMIGKRYSSKKQELV